MDLSLVYNLVQMGYYLEHNLDQKDLNFEYSPVQTDYSAVHNPDQKD